MKNTSIWAEIERQYRRLGFTAAANSLTEYGDIIDEWRNTPNTLLDILRRSG